MRNLTKTVIKEKMLPLFVYSL